MTIGDVIVHRKAKQTVQEWLEECPTNVETEFENGRYYIIRVDKRVEDTE